MKKYCIKISCGSIKNTKQKDKPNEDCVFCDRDKGVFILLDGVSRDNVEGKYPIPSPAVEAVQLLKESIYRSLLHSGGEPEDRLWEAIEAANKEVNQYNQIHNFDFAAGAVGIIALISNNWFYYAYIGDCSGRVITGQEVKVFTTCQTSNISKYKQEYTTYEIRNIICNDIKHPCGYGVLNGGEGAMDFIQTGRINIGSVDQIILSSDGMEDYLLQRPANVIQEKDARGLLDDAMKFNNKLQDDRSIIKIEVDNR